MNSLESLSVTIRMIKAILAPISCGAVYYALQGGSNF